MIIANREKRLEKIVPKKRYVREDRKKGVFREFGGSVSLESQLKRREANRMMYETKIKKLGEEKTDEVKGSMSSKVGEAIKTPKSNTRFCLDILKQEGLSGLNTCFKLWGLNFDYRIVFVGLIVLFLFLKVIK